MALFGTKRDTLLFSTINKELINDIIQAEVDIYKVSLDYTKTNVYGESNNTYFQTPIRLSCLMRSEEQESDYGDFAIDRKQANIFSFLRDTLVELNFVPEIGDIIHWNNIYWEIDHIVENNLFLKKNPNTNKDIGDNFGWSASIKCHAHMTQRNKINIEPTRGSNNNDDVQIKEKYNLYE